MLDKVQKLNNLKSTKGMSYIEVQNNLLIRPYVTMHACCLEVRKYQATWQECNLTKNNKIIHSCMNPLPLSCLLASPLAQHVGYNPSSLSSRILPISIASRTVLRQ
jgi:hypothetical protein